MDSDRSKYFSKDGHMLAERHHSFIEKQNQCALCGSLLEINVETYLEDYTLKEEAFCEKCGIKTRVKNHKMQ